MAMDTWLIHGSYQNARGSGYARYPDHWWPSHQRHAACFQGSSYHPGSAAGAVVTAKPSPGGEVGWDRSPATGTGWSASPPASVSASGVAGEGSAGCIHIEDHTVGVVFIGPATDDSNPCRTWGDGPCLANGRHHVGRQQLGVDLVLLCLPGAV